MKKNHAGIVQFRQGDVLLTKIDVETKGIFKPKDGMLILAEGELTGHAHRVSADSAQLVHGTGGRMILEVLHPTKLRHEEHASIDLMPGTYEVTRQREYDPNGNDALVGD